MDVKACAAELALMGQQPAAEIERVIRKYINAGLQAIGDHPVTRGARQQAAVNAIRAADGMYRVSLIQDFVLGLERAGGVDLDTAGRALNTGRRGVSFALESDELYRPRLIAAARAL
jgi:hypothetical protein